MVANAVVADDDKLFPSETESDEEEEDKPTLLVNLICWLV